MKIFSYINQLKKNLNFKLVIRNNSYFKIFIKKYTKSFSKYYYNYAPQYLKKTIHKFISSESSKQNSSYNQFTAVYFELRTRCNGTCSFCAASVQNEVRPDILMDFQLYKKAILELADMNYKGIIAFHINSEPLLIKNLDEYISFARIHLSDSWIQILSNGKSLNSVNGKKIIEAGIDELSLNIYNDNLKAKLPKNIIKFEKEVLLKIFNKKQIYAGHKNTKPRGKFIYYNIFRRLLNEVLTNRAGTAPNKKSNKSVLGNYGFCAYPFQQFNITANGNVSQCCCDLNFSNPMGNIRLQTIQEIWKGIKFTELRKNLLSGTRETSSLCSQCDFFGLQTPPKNLLRKAFYYLLKHN